MGPGPGRFQVKFSNRKTSFGCGEERRGDSAAPDLASKMCAMNTVEENKEVGGWRVWSEAAGSSGRKEGFAAWNLVRAGRAARAAGGKLFRVGP